MLFVGNTYRTDKQGASYVYHVLIPTPIGVSYNSLAGTGEEKNKPSRGSIGVIPKGDNGYNW